MKRLLQGKTGIILSVLFVLLLTLIIFMPLRFAFALAVPANSAVSAKAASGTIWNGKVADLKIGALKLGNMETALRIFPLFTARAEYRVERDIANGQPPLTGKLEAGSNTNSIQDMTGQIPIEMIDGRLALSHLELMDFSAVFAGGQCRNAQGGVRLMLKPGSLAGMGLTNGFLGQARCEGKSLLLPLVSQSSMERADIRLDANGDYSITVTVQNENPEIGPALSAAGFLPVAGGYRIVIKGQL